MSKLLASYDELIQTPLTRCASNPIIRHTAISKNWKEWQVQEPIVFNDPNDASKLIMFYAGARSPVGMNVSYIVTYIGRATAELANPFVWTDNPPQPILAPGANAYNEVSMRLDSMLHVDGVYWLYTTGISPDRIIADGQRPGFNSIHLARSTDGVHFTWHERPILLPGGDESDVSQAAVLKEGSKWYMYYSYRTKSGQVLPGIRLAISSDGLHWTKTGQTVLSCAPGGYDSRYYEWHQILRLGRDYVLLSECFDGAHWSVGAAHSKSPTTGWIRKDTPLFERSGVPGMFDQHHVATPAIYEVGSRVMLFYTGGNNLDDYTMSNWDMGVACSEDLLCSLKVRPS